LTVVVAGLLVWNSRENQFAEAHVLKQVNEINATLNSPGLNETKLHDVEKRLEKLKASPWRKAEIQEATGAFQERAAEWGEKEMQRTRVLIQNWQSVPNYGDWVARLESAEADPNKNWQTVWNACRYVCGNANHVLADRVRLQINEAFSARGNAEKDRSPLLASNEWRLAESHLAAAKDAQARDYWVAWTNAEIATLFFNQVAAKVAYRAASNAYSRVSGLLTDKGIEALLARYSGDRLGAMSESAGRAAALTDSREGELCYTKALSLWPEVLRTSVDELFRIVDLADASRNWEQGFQAAKDVSTLAEVAPQPEKAVWFAKADAMRKKLIQERETAQAAVPIPPSTPSIQMGLPHESFSNPPVAPIVTPLPRFQRVEGLGVVDWERKETWIVLDEQAKCLNNALDRDVIVDIKQKFGAELPNLEKLKELAAAAPVKWPNNEQMYLDIAFQAEVWSVNKWCCSDKAGVFYDFGKNREIRGKPSSAGVVILWKQGTPDKLAR